MQIKRFEAQDMASALRMVKEEFGPEAVILSARSLKADMGILGFTKRPGVEVTAAIDSSYGEAGNKIRSDSQPEENQAFKRPSRVKGAERKNPVASFQDRMRLFRTKRGAGSEKGAAFCRASAEAGALQRTLIALGVENGVAMDITDNLTKIEGARGVSDARELRSYLPSILKKMGVAAGPVVNDSGGQKVIALVGPTGVGKTTTIAKLAADSSLHGRGRLALLSTDDRRIAAAEQLKTYARIIGVPMGIASTNRELRGFIRDHRDKDLILIDTSGVSQRDAFRLSELKKVLGNRPAMEIHLVLSSTTKEEDLREIWEGFSVFPVNRLIFTKLDETSSYGTLLNLMVRSRVPVSYLASGQDVPEDIEVATLERVAGLVVGGENRESFLVSAPAEIVRRGKLPDERTSGSFYIANKNSDVFHCPDCAWVKKIKKENMVILESVSDAIDSRLKPCRLCNPAKVGIYETVCGGEEIKKRAACR